MSKCNTNALGLSLGILSGALMLLLSLLGLGGYALEAVEIMQAHHIFFDLTAVGIIAGIIEALIAGYVGGYLIAWLYNQFA